MLPLLALLPADDYLLRRVQREGEIVRYRMHADGEFVIQLPAGGGDQEMKFNADSLVKITFGSLTANGRAIKIAEKLEKMKVDGPMGAVMPPADKFPPIVFDGRLDALNRLRVLTRGGANPSAMSLAGSADPTNYIVFLPLPAERVRVGSMWPVPLPDAKSTIVARLESVKNGQGLVRLKGKIERADKLGRMSGMDSGSFQPAVDTKADVNGTVTLDMSTGSTISAETAIEMESETKMGAVSFEMSGTGKSTWTRL